MKKIVFAFLLVALAVASAKTYSLTLFESSVFAGKELKPGEYKLDLQDGKIVLHAGKTAIESAVKVETADRKNRATSVRYASADGKLHIREISLGGTNMKLIVD